MQQPRPTLAMRNVITLAAQVNPKTVDPSFALMLLACKGWPPREKLTLAFLQAWIFTRTFIARFTAVIRAGTFIREGT